MRIERSLLRNSERGRTKDPCAHAAASFVGSVVVEELGGFELLQHVQHGGLLEAREQVVLHVVGVRLARGRVGKGDRNAHRVSLDALDRLINLQKCESIELRGKKKGRDEETKKMDDQESMMIKPERQSRPRRHDAETTDHRRTSSAAC